MPLSEEENRLLEQMERALAAEDPKLASTMRGRTLERSAKIRTSVAALVFLVGVAGLMGGAVTRHTWLGIAGFVVMLASATVGLSAWRGRHAAPASSSETAQQAPRDVHGGWTLIHGGRSHRGSGRSTGRSRRQRRQRSAEGFMQRLEHRWERRRDQGF